MAETKSDSKSEGGGCLAMLIFVGFLVFGGYNWLDGQGYISHSRETTITAEASWLVGESKTCYSTPIEPQLATSIKVNAWDVTHSIYCDKGPEHQIKVNFWGKTERADQRAHWGVSWKCVKGSDSFTCYALD